MCCPLLAPPLFLSQVELYAWKCDLFRVVLTVFSRNIAARNFYVDRLNYTLDETDPSLWDQQTEYEILAKRNRKVTNCKEKGTGNILARWTADKIEAENAAAAAKETQASAVAAEHS
jgi:hypothetical protein